MTASWLEGYIEAWRRHPQAGEEKAVTQLYVAHHSHLYIVPFSSPAVAAQIDSTWHWL
jgi:hypothetical protein